MTTPTSHFDTLKQCWSTLYPDDSQELLQSFMEELKTIKDQFTGDMPQPDWYKDTVVYSVYVDLFNKTFQGLEDKLDYLQDLGVTCLWLLPILDSPMRDAGFDVRNYNRIRPELLGLAEDSSDEEQLPIFRKFMQAAHERGIRVIFDIAVNHSSEEHEWFQQAKSDPESPYRDYYIWSDSDQKYSEARIIFKGMVKSNWEKLGDQYYFHRFFEIQPDLNYRNPKVLIEAIRILFFWLNQGADGFRLDAIPYLWKKEGTISENLPETHTIIQFFRAALDYVRPGTLLLAEACQPPDETVKYFAEGNECHAGYHFPVMPRIYKTLAEQSREAVVNTLDPKFTPPIPEGCQWFSFLRCHDELTLEMVTPEERKIVYDHYCRDSRWDFREGEGISARLAELMNHDPQQIGLANSIMLTLVGTPILFYGDEFGKSNDEEFYTEMVEKSGYPDSRYFVRGHIPWGRVETALSDPNAFESKVFHRIRKQLAARKQHKCFGRGTLDWLEIKTADSETAPGILAYIRAYDQERVLVIHNLTNQSQNVNWSLDWGTPGPNDLLDQPLVYDSNQLEMVAHGYHWILLK